MKTINKNNFTATSLCRQSLGGFKMFQNFSVPYNIKMWGLGLLATAGLALQSCEKDETSEIQQHDTTFKFVNNGYVNEQLQTDKIAASADSATVRNVYLEATGDWSSLGKNGIDVLVSTYLKPGINAAKGKGKGKGNLNPKVGINPSDSTWLVQNGWTIQR